MTLPKQPGANPTRALPKTPRGRALFTVSWFMSGKMPRTNRDLNPVQVKEFSHVHA